MVDLKIIYDIFIDSIFLKQLEDNKKNYTIEELKKMFTYDECCNAWSSDSNDYVNIITLRLRRQKIEKIRNAKNL